METRYYWKSLEHKENKVAEAQAKANEFMESPIDALKEATTVDRRSFLKYTGAASLMAALAGCTRRPVQTIVPYAVKPEEITLGQPNFYASADPATGHGLLLRTLEGRPIKVDGNEDHPFGKGISARAQASILDLYDPDRLRAPRIGGKEVSWEEFDAEVTTKVSRYRRSQGQGGTYFFTSSVLSPSLQQAIDEYSDQHFVFDSLPMGDIRRGQKECYGTDVIPRYRFDKAELIVSIDADFLDTWLNTSEYESGFAKGRNLKASKSMNRLIAFESASRLTGANADQRIAIHPDDQLHIALAIANEVAVASGDSVRDIESHSAAAIESRVGIQRDVIQKVAKELLRNKGKSLVVAGGIAGKSKHAVELQNVVNYINSALGNEGRTIDGTNATYRGFQGSFSKLQTLIADMRSGAVKTLVIQGINPLYSLPKSLLFKEALEKVENVIYLTQYDDETAKVANYVAAESHPFEAWGDVNPSKGVYSIQQPTIRPLWKTRSLLDCLVSWAPKVRGVDLPGSAYELVQRNWRSVYNRAGSPGDFLAYWEKSLQDGVVDFNNYQNASGSARTYRNGALTRAIQFAKVARPKSPSGSYTLVMQPTVALGDGAQANNSTLQELPDPVTKCTWGNYLSVSKADAERLSVKEGDVVSVENATHKVELPVHIQPGLKSGVVVTQLGYGREFNGRVGNGVGASVIDFALSVNNVMEFIGQSVKINKTGRTEQLACTQSHHTLDGRDIVFETTHDEYLQDPHSGIVHHLDKIESIWPEHKYESYRWGMAIDLTNCTGCSSCIVACNVENNVPAVGKDEVLKGREMHWLRIDRYYSGDSESPEVLNQPMLCQHCENAPCETVCPVIATVHNDEGINSMIYNRCVGTRYCANNCPFKVRRFNFLEYNTGMNQPMEHPVALSKNPDVTIRSRGVMEKCSFCQQRITFAKNEAKNEGRRVKDGEVKVACQEACPSDAIIFGDMNDPTSRLSKVRKDRRMYFALEETNVKSSVGYLTKVRNRKPLPKADGHHGNGGHH